MNKDAFSRIAESLRQYRRAELRDFSKELGDDPVNSLYVDPLPGDAILRSVMSSNTTFLLGRKGTGKSTIFAKAQIAYRNSRDVLSVYVDVKSLYELLSPEGGAVGTAEEGIDPGICRTHILRKAFLGTVISELLKEIDKTCNTMSFLEVWRGVRRSYKELQRSILSLREQVAEAKLENHEIPVLQRISNTWRSRSTKEHGGGTKVEAGGEMGVTGPKIKASASLSDFDKALEDAEVYKEYSEVVLQAFPFSDLLSEIKDLLEEARMKRLVVFFDDFSELNYVDQRLFVDVVLSPLNNASNEKVKLKIAGYPGRVYYGKIDPSKVDTISIDFSALYEATEMQEMEAGAIDYATRLLNTRFSAFGQRVVDYFDPVTSIEDYMRLMFQASFNVPRLMGALLHTCYLDRVSKGQSINQVAIRLAARKYYEATISQYFDRMLRYALEPFENKLDRHNQKGLLECIVAEARTVRRKIQDGSIGGSYFKELGNPPTSHFIVQPSLEQLFRSLEANFFITRYKDTRDKNGDPVIVYALNYGIIETHRMSWGYPPGREYRNYFVQRCFDYSRAIQEYLSKKQTIRCGNCGGCFPMEKKESFELFNWLCPECKQGTCCISILAEDFKDEFSELVEETMIDPIELDILSTLHEEGSGMRAGEISVLMDVTYQLVGKRTSKLQEMGLVTKERSQSDNHMRSHITSRAENTYFADP
jgi:DNA-binding transcriptional ArsR family regulator